MWLITRKLHLPVDAARPSLYKRLLILCLMSLALSAQAEEHFLGQMHVHTPAELATFLQRAETWAEENPDYPENAISVVLHGPEAQAFVKDNYKQHRQLVDRAAKLDAFNVVDIKICETWMGMNQVQRNQLPAFIDTVPFGPAEEDRLIKAGYQKF